MALTQSDRGRLASFRKAAREVREASIVAGGEDIQIRALPNGAGNVDIFVQLLSKEPFRSLALAIRLAYQQGEPAHFYSICNLLFRKGDQETKERVAALREQYRAALSDPAGQILIGEGEDGAVFTAEQVLEHWLYGIAFHQDAKRQAAVEQLASVGAMFPWKVQSTSLQLAGRILDLDDVVADVLGEPRLPRIEAGGTAV